MKISLTKRPRIAKEKRKWRDMKKDLRPPPNYVKSEHSDVARYSKQRFVICIALYSYNLHRLLTHDSKLFVSVMAGVTLKSLSLSLSRVAKNPRIIRTHPNTPATIGCGCAVYSLGDGKLKCHTSFFLLLRT